QSIPELMRDVSGFAEAVPTSFNKFLVHLVHVLGHLSNRFPSAEELDDLLPRFRDDARVVRRIDRRNVSALVAVTFEVCQRRDGAIGKAGITRIGIGAVKGSFGRLEPV